MTDGSRVLVRVVLALVVAVFGIVAVVVLAGRARQAATTAGSGPLAVAAVDQPGAATAACRQVMAAVPSSLGPLPRRELIAAPDGVAAWGDPAVVLRCGMPDPAELSCSAELVQINNVQWLQLDGVDGTTFLAVDRAVRVAVTVPNSTGISPVQLLSGTLAATLPTRAVCEAGSLVPTDH